MQPTRTVMGGLMASLGTSGTMVAASACLFFVASTMIAFNSWTGSSLSNTIESLFVGEKSSVSVGVPGPQSLAANASTAAAAVTPGSGRADRAATGASAPAELGSPVPEQSGPAVGGSGSFPVDVVGAVVALPAPQIDIALPDIPEVALAEVGAPSLGGVVADTTNTLGGTVEQTTDQLGATLGGVNPALGGVVTSTGETLGGVLGNTGGSLGAIVDGTGQTVGGLLPAGG